MCGQLKYNCCSLMKIRILFIEQNEQIWFKHLISKNFVAKSFCEKNSYFQPIGLIGVIVLTLIISIKIPKGIYSPARLRWWYTLVNFHWARVRFGPVPLASCGNGSGVNSPTAVSFTVLSQTPRRPSYFQNSIIAWAMLIYFGYWIASKSEKAY